MKKVNYLLLGAAIVLITACSDNDLKSPSVEKEDLGLIVPQINDSENALLLEDGTLTRPVSGIDDFNTRTPGNKLFLSYRILDVENGITNIAVTHFAEANDSTFNPDPDTFEPINIEDFVYGTDFSGQYYIANEDSTEIHTGQISFSFGVKQPGNSEYTYTITPNGGEPFSGAGEFEIADGHLIFENSDDDEIMVPAGEFVTSAGTTSLYLWPVEFTGLYRTYALSVVE